MEQPWASLWPPPAFPFLPIVVANHLKPFKPLKPFLVNLFHFLGKTYQEVTHQKIKEHCKKYFNGFNGFDSSERPPEAWKIRLPVAWPPGAYAGPTQSLRGANTSPRSLQTNFRWTESRAQHRSRPASIYLAKTSVHLAKASETPCKDVCTPCKNISASCKNMNMQCKMASAPSQKDSARPATNIGTPCKNISAHCKNTRTRCKINEKRLNFWRITMKVLCFFSKRINNFDEKWVHVSGENQKND